MWEAEDNGLELPYACRMGCCTACAVKIMEGDMYQPQALGISQVSLNDFNLLIEYQSRLIRLVDGPIESAAPTPEDFICV